MTVEFLDMDALAMHRYLRRIKRRLVRAVPRCNGYVAMHVPE